MDKLLLYLVCCYFIWKNALAVDYCDTDDALDFAFSIDNRIFFGINSKQLVWLYDTDSHNISDSGNIGKLFGDPAIKLLVSVFRLTEKLLGLKECAKNRNTDDYCRNTAKAKDFAIILHYIDLKLHYLAVNYSDTTKQSEMPWGLPNKGEFVSLVNKYANITGKTFLIDAYRTVFGPNILGGLAFDANDKNLLVSVVNNGVLNGRIISSYVDSNSVFYSQHYDYPNYAFYGLLKVEQLVYGLDARNNIYSLELVDNRLIASTYMSAKKFFHCETDSKNESMTPSTSGEMIRSSLSTSTSLSTTTSKSVSPSEQTKSKLTLYIFLVILFVFIMCICLAVFFYCRLKKTKNASEKVSSNEATGSKEDVVSSQASTRTLT